MFNLEFLPNQCTTLYISDGTKAMVAYKKYKGAVVLSSSYQVFLSFQWDLMMQ